jgi:CBS domain-containing protein
MGKLASGQTTRSNAMQVRDIMTRKVVSASPETPVLELAGLLVDHGISAVPVTIGERVVGMVSEADLLHRHELGTQRDPAALHWWQRLLAGDGSPGSYVEAYATKVEDIMTTPVVSVTENLPVRDLAALLESHNIRRAPVLRAGSMVGIVSRADFVRALVAQGRVRDGERSRSDESIRRALVARLEAQRWWHAQTCELTVSDGIVHLAGLVDSAEQKAATRVAAENVPGVRGIEDVRTYAIPAGGYL